MSTPPRFRGWFVAWTAFTIAVFAWGAGFYGPPVFLEILHATRGWPIATIASAITAHFLLSAAIIIYLPEIHGRLGVASTTILGVLLTAVGLLAWAGAREPWHLFAAAVPSGIGWAVTSGAALNAMIAPWFDRERPKAMSLAFNGASIGGVVFVPLWLVLIERFGFLSAAMVIGAAAILTVGTLAAVFLRGGPEHVGQHPDGLAQPAAPQHDAPPRSRSALMRDWRFITLSAAFALALFAQIGVLAHLITRLAAPLGIGAAGAAVSLATLCAVIGRTATGWWLGDCDRRVAAAMNFLLQAAGVVLLAFGATAPMLWLGCILFGLGIGNLTSLPPLIAQREFDRADVAGVVALVVAINQATFALAPAVFGALRDWTTDYRAAFALAAIVQIGAALIVVTGRDQRVGGRRVAIR
jgi:MFS family permease